MLYFKNKLYLKAKKSLHTTRNYIFNTYLSSFSKKSDAKINILFQMSPIIERFIGKVDQDCGILPSFKQIDSGN